MNLQIPNLTTEQNIVFNDLLEEFANGCYWENEGYKPEHAELRPKAEATLQQWLDETFNQLSK